ncbi:30S ribosome-binding factor RbfA [Spiroplasma endosymbiont of Polydrusus formosus]|uniref:30S ribosome-binding factor RbfA n=1 Tax=Spiroplasma endosymbiont of Polydrusus formosus TaxID=3139326 RepID=UPI0035B4FCED
MVNKIKVERMQSLIARDLTIIMQREIRDDILNTLSVHAVKLSNDLGHAKVYYSPLLNKPEAELNPIVQNYKSEIRSKLAHKLEIYRCPDLEFIFDHSLDNANSIESILQNLK